MIDSGSVVGLLAASTLAAGASIGAYALDSKSPTDKIVGKCFLVEKRSSELTPEESAENYMQPILALKNYFQDHGMAVPNDVGSVSVVIGPVHGKLTDQGGGSYIYSPTPDYVGKDTAKFSIMLGGKNYRLDTFIRVLPTPIGNDGYKEKCGSKGISWRISIM